MSGRIRDHFDAGIESGGRGGFGEKRGGGVVDRGEFCGVAVVCSHGRRYREVIKLSLSGEDELKSGEGGDSSRRRRDENYHLRLITVN